MTEVYYDLGPCFSLICRSLYDFSAFIIELPQFHPVTTIQGDVQLETLFTQEDPE